jgi:uncharacterized protein (UPF0264 family)
MSRLLVSVRSVAEALAALDGGADVIDVKEPAHGSLGAAKAETVVAIVAAVAGRRPVSAALGELRDWNATATVPTLDLTFVKWGLSQCRGTDWPAWFRRAARQVPGRCRPVVVAYADADRAAAPPLEAIVAFAQAESFPLLVDTFIKDGSTLLDWRSRVQLESLVRDCRSQGIPLALAGSLTAHQLRELASLTPDWFAVRGAACQAGDRAAEVSRHRVEQLADLVHRGPFSP